MIFLKDFYSGTLLSKQLLLFESNKLQIEMIPIQYASGFMRIPLGQIMTLFGGEGELVGHSSSTASLAFYCPQKDLYIVGDFNQL